MGKRKYSRPPDVAAMNEKVMVDWENSIKNQALKHLNKDITKLWKMVDREIIKLHEMQEQINSIIEQIVIKK